MIPSSDSCYLNNLILKKRNAKEKNERLNTTLSFKFFASWEKKSNPFKLITILQPPTFTGFNCLYGHFIFLDCDSLVM